MLRSLLYVLLCFSAVCFADPDLKKFKINGLDVYLINTHFGNGVALVTNVMVGSEHDEPHRMAGRAHLFEHVIHAGSLKFPGQHTLDKMRHELGADSNAYTADNRTVYHDFFHSDSLEQGIVIQGSLVSAPEWNKETFLKEKGPVLDEALQYQGRDGDAFEGTLSLHLFPEGHYFGKFTVGTQEQLHAMTIDDLKELYYSNYVAGSMQVIVAGNFDALPDGTIPLNEERVLALIGQNYFPADTKNDPDGYQTSARPLREQVFPPFVSPDQKTPRFLEMKTKLPTRYLILKFSADSAVANANPADLETLLDYLSLDIEGSFAHQIKSLGFISDMNKYVSTLNNIAQINISFTMTEKGYSQRDFIVREFYNFLHEIRTAGIRTDVMEYLRKRNIFSYREAGRDAAWAAQALATGLSNQEDPTKIFRFTDKFGHVQLKDMKELAEKIFRAENMLGAYAGPEVESSINSKIFERPIRFPDISQQLSTWKNALENGCPTCSVHVKKSIKLPDLKFDYTSEPRHQLPDQNAKTLVLGQTGVNAVFEESHRTPTTAILAYLTPPPQSARMTVAMNLFMEALRVAKTTEIDFLYSMGMRTKLGGDPYGGLGLAAQGNSAAAPQVTNWLLDQMINYTPTEKDFETAKQEIHDGLVSQQEDFPARIAMTTISTLVHASRFQPSEFLKVLGSISLAEVIAAKKTWFSRLDLGVSVVGDMSEGEVRDYIAQLQSKLPKALTEKQRASRSRTYDSLPKKRFWTPNVADDDSIAIARIYDRGPIYGTREGFAWEIIGEWMRNSLYELNRAEKGLGYVHGAQISAGVKGQSLILYGQTDKSSRFAEIEEGWQEIFRRIKNNEVPKEDLDALRRGSIRVLSLIPTEQLSTAAKNFDNERLTGDANKTPFLLKEAATLTSDEIIKVGQKYATAERNYLDVIVSTNKPNCKVFLSPTTMRKRLK